MKNVKENKKNGRQRDRVVLLFHFCW